MRESLQLNPFVSTSVAATAAQDDPSLTLNLSSSMIETHTLEPIHAQASGALSEVAARPNAFEPIIQIRAVSADADTERIVRFLTGKLNSVEARALHSLAGAGAVIEIGKMGNPRTEAPPAEHLQSEARVFPVRLARHQIFLGPTIDAGGPCPACLEKRWLALRPADERRALEEQRGGYSHGENPWLTPFALETFWQVLQRIAFTNTRLAGEENIHGRELHVVNLETLRVVRGFLVNDSRCPSCSTCWDDNPESAALTLQSRPKRHPDTYRLTKINDLELSEKSYVNPVCGVIGPVGVPDLTQSLSAAVTGQFEVVDFFGDRKVWWSGHANNFNQSMKIGMLEGLERYSGLLPRGRKMTVRDSLGNLGDDALDPRTCGLYHPNFYLKKPQYKPFTPELEFTWVWGYSLTEQRPILVPKQMVYYMDYTTPDTLFVQDCSSGCAAGSSLEEAILFGLLELIERDSFLISWFAQLALPRIDPWSCRNTELLQVLDRIELMGCDVHLLDMRLDLKVPSVMCFTRRRDDRFGSFVLAAGASLDPEDAIRGALCEVASYLPSAENRVARREEKLREVIQDYSRLDNMEDHSLLYGLPEMAAQTEFLLSNPKLGSVNEIYGDWLSEKPRHTDLLDDLNFCIAQLKSVGLEQIIVVDQTAPEQERLGLKTVCVIVPGLIPIDFSYDRQRIYDLPRMFTVPRTAGFRQTDLRPEELNVLPHPFP
jgi:ribosomal protein S12 methylthiotransferase accessory factor